MRRLIAHGLAAVIIAGSCAASFYYARKYVEETVGRPAGPPAVVFSNRPAWMSDLVARQLADSFQPTGVKSVFDREMLVSVSQRLKASPWIAELRQVRRAYVNGPGDTLEVDCDFRAPMALARFDSDYWFVDAHGIKLPERFNAADLPRIIYAADGSTNVRVIDGIRHAPPKEAGKQWVGEDLVAGLELVCRLYDQPFAQEIVAVNVANFAGRIDPREAQIVLETKYKTEVRWGRPWSCTDAFIEVPPERKVSYLRQLTAKYGRVDGRQAWIDIRFDRVTQPADSGAEANDSR